MVAPPVSAQPDAVESDSDESLDDAVVRDTLPSPATPIGLRFAEALEGKDLRLGYSFERIRSQGLIAGDDDLTRDFARDVLGFSRTPRALDLTIHTLDIAYAPHPRVTLVARVPFVQRDLERVEATGQRFSDQTEGVGDLEFAAVVPFIRKGRESSQVHVAISAPTGSFRRSERGSRLPYDSQLGIGSWQLEWGWTYRGEWKRLAWGGQATGRHPLNRNDLRYRAGSRWVGTLWGAARIVNGLSVSFRTEWEKQNNLNGFDRSFDPRSDVSENDKLRGGSRLRLSPGVSLEVPQLNGQRIAFEASVPVYQDLDGPQLEEDWSFKTAWQWVY